MNSLRDIIYLDRVRVESYISQLAGGLAIQEATGANAEKSKKGELGFLGVAVGGEFVHNKTLSTTRVPAYAILGTLEDALRDAGGLVGDPRPAMTPGKIVQVKGDMTLESWGLLASLADNLQGAGLMGAKVYSRMRGAKDLAQMGSELNEIKMLLKKKIGHPLSTSPEDKKKRHEALAKRLRAIHIAFEILTDGYIDDVKEIIKLFFQDQHHVKIQTRINEKTTTLVGPLRSDGLVGSSMEELVFAYGARPAANFTMLAQVTEFAREQPLDFALLSQRFTALKGEAPSLQLIQRAIREAGGAILEIAEELRRPFGKEFAFAVPLAIYREVHL